MSAASLKRKATEVASAAKKPKADKSITSFFSAPPTSSSAAQKKRNPLSESDALIALAEEDDSAAAAPPQSQAPLDSSGTLAVLPKFDKEKWVAKLTPEQKELLSLEIESLHESWLAQLKDEVLTKEFLDLKRFLKAEKEAGQKVFPPEREIYIWFVSSFLFSNLKLLSILNPHNLNFAMLFIHCPFQYYTSYRIWGHPSQSISVSYRVKTRCKNQLPPQSNEKDSSAKSRPPFPARISQVPTYPSQYRQSRHPRTRPIPQ